MGKEKVVISASAKEFLQVLHWASVIFFHFCLFPIDYSDTDYMSVDPEKNELHLKLNTWLSYFNFW